MPYKKREETNFNHDNVNFDMFGNLTWTRPELECLWTIYRHDKVAIFNWFKTAEINLDKSTILVDNACQRDWIREKYKYHLDRHHKRLFEVVVRQ